MDKGADEERRTGREVGIDRWNGDGRKYDRGPRANSIGWRACRMLPQTRREAWGEHAAWGPSAGCTRLEGSGAIRIDHIPSVSPCTHAVWEGDGVTRLGR